MSNILNLILEKIELTKTEYDIATERYESLGSFLALQSEIKSYEPEIFPQGSFRLGTAIKPLNPEEPYDLDLTCKLKKNIDILHISQKQLKELVQKQIEKYRDINGIIEPLEQKHRCIRLQYRGKPNFYMDIVPGIPTLEDTNKLLTESLLRNDIPTTDANNLVKFAYNITDDRNKDYNNISLNWNISNPEGYAQWFEGRMKKQKNFQQSLILNEDCKPVPTFLQKTILQRCVQLLKRHRDIMYKNDNQSLKPISIIITTLAAKAYQGENTINEAIIGILNRMEKILQESNYKVKNPTIPEENFADKWEQNKELKKEFERWLYMAQIDFDLIINNLNSDTILKEAKNKFGVTIDENNLTPKHFVNQNLKKPTNLDNVQIRLHRC